MASVKISALPTTTIDNVKAGSTARVSSTGIIIPVTENATTKGLKIDQLFGAVGNLTASGTVVIGGAISSSNGPLPIIGSTEVTGSLRVNTGNEAISLDTGTGGFTVNNLLDVLANYSSSGVEGGVASGDINLDGQVNVNDMLLVLAGFGNPNLIVTNTVIPPNVNHQFIGPTISINTGVTLTISTGSFCSITL